MRFTGQNKKNLNVRYFLNEADERVDIQGEPMYIKGKRPVDVKGEPLYIRGGLPKVRQLQNLLKVAGLYGKKVDGIVGPETIKAVEQMAGVPAGTTNKQEIIDNVESYLMWASKAASAAGGAAVADAIKKSEYTPTGLGADIAAASAYQAGKAVPPVSATQKEKPISKTPQQPSSFIGRKIGEPKEGDVMKGELGPEVYHNGEWMPQSEYQQLKKGLEEAKSRDTSYNRIRDEKNKKLFEALVGTNIKKKILNEQDEVVGLPGEVGQATSAVAGKEGTPTQGDYLFAQAIMKLSNAIFQDTGIRVLDPTANKSPPSWSKQFPNVYATLQTSADLLASDPFALALMLVPASKLSGPATKALSKAGASPEVISSLLQQRTIGQALAKIGPEKASKIISILDNTEVKTVMQDFLQNLAKQNPANVGKTVAYSAEAAGAEGAQAVAQAVAQTGKKVASGKLQSIQSVLDSQNILFSDLEKFVSDSLEPLAKQGQKIDINKAVDLAKNFMAKQGIDLGEITTTQTNQLKQLLSSVSTQLEVIASDPVLQRELANIRSGKTTGEAFKSVGLDLVRAIGKSLVGFIEQLGPNVGRNATLLAIIAAMIYVSYRFNLQKFLKNKKVEKIG